MARANRRKIDPYAKKVGETDLQWRLRVIAQKQEARDKANPIITPETERQARYEDVTVYHIETGKRAETKRRRSISSLVRMHTTGALSNEQYAAALRIAHVIERIERGASVRCASLEARVDCSRSGHDVMIERLSQVRDEVAYSSWRRQIPLPRRMILDMILADRPLAVTARKHGVRWARARELFIDALDLWCKLRARAVKDVGEDDVIRAQARIAA